jgi:hypothetical protein
VPSAEQKSWSDIGSLFWDALLSKWCWWASAYLANLGCRRAQGVRCRNIQSRTPVLEVSQWLSLDKLASVDAP